LSTSKGASHQEYTVLVQKEHSHAKQKVLRARFLDPLSLIIDRALGVSLYDARQCDQAIEQERKTLDWDPNFILAHSDPGLAYLQKSMYQEGIAEFEKALVISPGNPLALSGLGPGGEGQSI
jgi:tetratricopeptide (TPR) repeat protein